MHNSKMVLKVKVMDDDIGSDEKLGETKIKLEDLGEFFSSDIVVIFRLLGTKSFSSWYI